MWVRAVLRLGGRLMLGTTQENLNKVWDADFYAAVGVTIVPVKRKANKF